jgi:hypothetical protein
MSPRRSDRKQPRASRNRQSKAPLLEPGKSAHADGIQLHTYEVGALPIINDVLDRMDLERVLTEHLPPDDPRTELPTAQVLLVMVRNLLLSREPIYGVGEWAARFAPDLFNLWEDEVNLLSDDRVGRGMSRAHPGSRRSWS